MLLGEFTVGYCLTCTLPKSSQPRRPEGLKSALVELATLQEWDFIHTLQWDLSLKEVSVLISRNISYRFVVALAKYNFDFSLNLLLPVYGTMPLREVSRGGH